MNTKFNWKFPLVMFLIVGGYYVYNVNYRHPKGPLKIYADSVVFKHGCATPESSCLKINFTFPSIASDVSSKLVEGIYSDYLQMVEDSAGVSSLNDLKNRLVEHSCRFDTAYVDFSKEFPDASFIAWYLKISYEIARNDGKVLSICYFYSDYMGGAHGMYSYHYQNFDLKKSKSIGFEDVFGRMDDFCAIAQAAFNKKFFEQSSDTAKWGFPKDKFVLPREFGLGAKGLILHYNVYEIASYAQGDIIIEIPYSELKSVLLPRWKYLVEQ